MKFVTNKIKYNYIMFLFTVLIFLFSLSYISGLTIPTFLNDEFGYLANAAFLAGKDWSGITRISAYYSYGYSIVLVPLFWVFKNTSHLYKAIILLNTLFYVISYYVSFITIKSIFKKVDQRYIAFVCGIAALYGANIYNVNYAWSEPILYFVFWLLIYKINQIYQNCQSKDIVIFSLLLIYMYTIHQRTIGIVFVGVLCILGIYLNKKINTKQFVIFIVSIIMCTLLAILMKYYIQSHLWNNPITSKLANTNDYGGQIKKIVSIIQSPSLIWNLFKGIIGKYYYLMISTGSFITFGVIKCSREIIDTYKKKREVNIIFLFMLLSLFVMLTISSIFFITAERFDTVLYGRYSEFAMLPLLICGILAFKESDFSIKYLIINIVILVISYFLLKNFLSGTKNYIFPCTTNASLFYDTATRAFAYNKYVLTGVILCIGVYLFITRKQFLLQILSFVLLIGFWNISVSTSMQKDKLLAQDNISNVISIADRITENYPTYYLYDGNYEDIYPRMFIDDIQYRLVNRTILITNSKEMKYLKGKCYLITYGDEFNETKYKQITETIGYHLYVLN